MGAHLKVCKAKLKVRVYFVKKPQKRLIPVLTFLKYRYYTGPAPVLKIQYRIGNTNHEHHASVLFVKLPIWGLLTNIWLVWPYKGSEPTATLVNPKLKLVFFFIFRNRSRNLTSNWTNNDNNNTSQQPASTFHSQHCGSRSGCHCTCRCGCTSTSL
jgi:hypothetical protein